MTILYSNSGLVKYPIYMCNHYNIHYGEKICQNVQGRNIDLTIESLLLEIINPLTMETAISIQSEMTKRKEEILRLYSQQLERARYEMDLAKLRYLLVDPGNRLVAAELEHDWNKKSAAHKAYAQKSCAGDNRFS